jgi:hypothetical protein
LAAMVLQDRSRAATTSVLVATQLGSMDMYLAALTHCVQKDRDLGPVAAACMCVGVCVNAQHAVPLISLSLLVGVGCCSLLVLWPALGVSFLFEHVSASISIWVVDTASHAGLPASMTIRLPAAESARLVNCKLQLPGIN